MIIWFYRRWDRKRLPIWSQGLRFGRGKSGNLFTASSREALICSFTNYELQLYVPMFLLRVCFQKSTTVERETDLLDSSTTSPINFLIEKECWRQKRQNINDRTYNETSFRTSKHDICNKNFIFTWQYFLGQMSSANMKPSLKLALVKADPFRYLCRTCYDTFVAGSQHPETHR